jgi:hypothetical protein
MQDKGKLIPSRETASHPAPDASGGAATLLSLGDWLRSKRGTNTTWKYPATLKN